MKPLLYPGLVVGLVPLQVTLLSSLGIGGIRPDLTLIAACLVGILGGAVDGLIVGMILGYEQSLFSAGELWLGLTTEGLVGLFAGLAGRRLTHATPVSVLGLLAGLSAMSGLAFFMARSSSSLSDQFFTLGTVLVPETACNAVVGMGLYWLLAGYARTEQDLRRMPPGLVR